jgi:hypothetical protein
VAHVVTLAAPSPSAERFTSGVPSVVVRTCVNPGGMTLAVPQGSGHSARRVGSAGRLTWGLVATGTLLLAWGAPELMSW